MRCEPWSVQLKTENFLLFHLLYHFIVILLQLSQFPPLPTSAHPTPCSHSLSPPCCPCPWVIHTCSLSNPFPFFPPFPTPVPSGHCQSVPCFHACGSSLFISLFCSLNSSYRWDHILRLLFNVGINLTGKYYKPHLFHSHAIIEHLICTSLGPRNSKRNITWPLPSRVYTLVEIPAKRYSHVQRLQQDIVEGFTNFRKLETC